MLHVQILPKIFIASFIYKTSSYLSVIHSSLFELKKKIRKIKGGVCRFVLFNQIIKNRENYTWYRIRVIWSSFSVMKVSSSGIYLLVLHHVIWNSIAYWKTRNMHAHTSTLFYKVNNSFEKIKTKTFLFMLYSPRMKSYTGCRM